MIYLLKKGKLSFLKRNGILKGKRRRYQKWIFFWILFNCINQLYRVVLFGSLPSNPYIFCCWAKGARSGQLSRFCLVCRIVASSSTLLVMMYHIVLEVRTKNEFHVYLDEWPSHKRSTVSVASSTSSLPSTSPSSFFLSPLLSFTKFIKFYILKK